MKNSNQKRSANDLSSLARRTTAIAAFGLLTLTLPVGAGSTGQTNLYMPQGADAGTANGDYVIANTAGLNTFYSYFVEVPPGLSRLVVELFDVDVGDGGAGEVAAQRDRDRGGVYDSTFDYALRESVRDGGRDGDGGVGRRQRLVHALRFEHCAAVSFVARCDRRPADADVASIGVGAAGSDRSQRLPAGVHRSRRRRRSGRGDRPRLDAASTRALAAAASPVTLGLSGASLGCSDRDADVHLDGRRRPSTGAILALPQRQHRNSIRRGVDDVDRNDGAAEACRRSQPSPTTRWSSGPSLNRRTSAPFSRPAGTPSVSTSKPRVAAATRTVCLRVVPTSLTPRPARTAATTFTSTTGLAPVWRESRSRCGPGRRPTATGKSVSTAPPATTSTPSASAPTTATSGSGGIEIPGLLRFAHPVRRQSGRRPDDSRLRRLPLGHQRLPGGHQHLRLRRQQRREPGEHRPDQPGELGAGGTAYTQTVADAALSGNDVWVRNTFGPWTTDFRSTRYGIWRADVKIRTYMTPAGLNGNYTNMYLAPSTQPADPPSQPEVGVYRVYLPTDISDTSMPVKPYLEQLVTHVSGPNPPTVGVQSIAAVTIRVVNPTPAGDHLLDADQHRDGEYPRRRRDLRRLAAGLPGHGGHAARGRRHRQHHLEPRHGRRRQRRRDDRRRRSRAPDLPRAGHADLGRAARRGHRQRRPRTAPAGSTSTKPATRRRRGRPTPGPALRARAHPGRSRPRRRWSPSSAPSRSAGRWRSSGRRRPRTARPASISIAGMRRKTTGIWSTPSSSWRRPTASRAGATG